MLGREIKLTARLMNIEAWLFIAERNKEVGHQSPEEVAAPVIVLLKNANLSGVKHAVRISLA